MKLRKTIIIKETTETDGFGKACDPVTRVVAIAVVQNPFVRAFGEDLSPLFNLNRRSVGMPFRDWWAVYETIFAILLVGLAPTIKAGSANPKITARIDYMPGLLGISKSA
jgi:hypothetical protein